MPIAGDNPEERRPPPPPPAARRAEPARRAGGVHAGIFWIKKKYFKGNFFILKINVVIISFLRELMVPSV